MNCSNVSVYQGVQVEFVPFAPTDEDIIYPDLGIIQVLTTVKILVTILKIHVIKMPLYITLMYNDEYTELNMLTVRESRQAM